MYTLYAWDVKYFYSFCSSRKYVQASLLAKSLMDQRFGKVQYTCASLCYLQLYIRCILLVSFQCTGRHQHNSTQTGLILISLIALAGRTLAVLSEYNKVCLSLSQRFTHSSLSDVFVWLMPDIAIVLSEQAMDFYDYVQSEPTKQWVPLLHAYAVARCYY